MVSSSTEAEASSEESPSADDEEQAASSAAPAEGEEGDAAGETEPTENGDKAEGAAEEKGEEGTEKKEWVFDRELVCNSERCDISLWSALLSVYIILTSAG